MKHLNSYKEMHEDEAVYDGCSLNLHAQSIKDIISLSGATTLLDYGCGKGMQYSREKYHEKYFFGIMPELYDPAVAKYSVLPKGKFDGVICTDVLEHVPEEELDKVLTKIYSKATEFVYLGICTIPAKAFLPSGEDAHVTLKSFDWWVDKIRPHAILGTQVYCYGLTRGTARIEDSTVIFKKER